MFKSNEHWLNLNDKRSSSLKIFPSISKFVSITINLIHDVTGTIVVKTIIEK